MKYENCKKINLREIKNRLYAGENALLYTYGKKITELEFLNIIFPNEFYSKPYEDTNGKIYSLEKLVDKKNTAQRNKIFNRNYKGYVLKNSIFGIFSIKPDLWLEICNRCKVELLKSKDIDRVIEYFDYINNNEIYDAEYHEFVENTLKKETHFAFAAIIIYLLLDGNIVSEESDLKLLKLFSIAFQYDEQFDYMKSSCGMLSSSLGDSIGPKDFERLCDENYDNYSELLSYVAKVKINERPHKYSHLFNTLYSIIEKNETNKLIRITGAAGTKKTAITQFLYLKLASEVRNGTNIEFAPYYINLDYYDQINESNTKESNRQLSEDAHEFHLFCEEHPKRIPIVFIDGVRKYALEKNTLDFHLNEFIDKDSRTRIILSVEEGVTTNSIRQRKTPAFANGKYNCEVTMEAFYIPDKEISIPFLNKFKEIFCKDKKIDIYERLMQLGLIRIDISQLCLLLPCLADLSNENISELYDAVCTEYLFGDSGDFSKVAQWAYDFAYTEKKLTPLSKKWKSLLCRHSSVLEFFIANWYIDKIREGSKKDNIGTLNLVMPKGITRFIVPLLNKNTIYESHILNLIENNYDRMGLMAQSEMTYWLGRIKSKSMSDRAEKLLMKYYENQKQQLSKSKPNDEDYKKKLFLLRGIAVSLIVKGRALISNEYIISLINNKIANEINRGFHLEYYGDKEYLPLYDTLDFMDDLTRGKRTLDRLIAANNGSIEVKEIPPVFELNLFTICSLLQVRVERPNIECDFDLKPYLKKAHEQLKWYLNYQTDMNTMIKEYFLTVKRDFDERIRCDEDNWSSVEAIAYKTYCKKIHRTGWEKRNIPDSETVAEHMYRCWLMGMMYLPDTYDDEKEYSKEKILNLLLLHDISEVIMGDIERPAKLEDPEYFDNIESQEMGIFFLRGSYRETASQPELYSTWQCWNNSKNINGRIAKEIDTIQAIFQLLTYVKEYPEAFDDKTMIRWLSERKDIKTKHGKKIYELLIEENREFFEILKKYNVI